MGMSTAVLAGPEEWQLGDLRISHGWHGRGGSPPSGAELLIPVGAQPLLVSMGSLEPILRPPLDLLYLPAGQEGVRTSGFAGWRIHLDPERLCRLALELVDHRLTPVRLRRRLKRLTLLQPRLSPERELVLGLGQMLQLGRQPRIDPGLLAQLGADRIIQRTLVMLLCTDLIQPTADGDTPVPVGRAAIIPELLAWIDAHLDQPLQLADLAARSGYSPRSLRNIFHERFGCSPVQWIRNRRLTAARARLLEPQPGDTVGSIAAAFGYRHPSQFSRDFHALHGVRPSELLREGARLI